MGSEKSGAPDTVLVFESAADADRRIAGVAAAARIVRQRAEAGDKSVWLAIPGGKALDRHTLADLDRLADGATFGVHPAEGLSGSQGLQGLEGSTIMAAPRPSARDVLLATGKSSDGPVSQALNRPISRRISALLLHIPAFRPIHATIGTALISATMLAALLLGGSVGLIAGGLLFHAASIFDGVDGEVARATYRSSPAGAALDSAVDVATNCLFILGVTINLAARGHPEAIALGGWGLLVLLTGLLAIGWRRVRSDGSLNFDLVKDHYRTRYQGLLFRFLVGFATTVTSRDFFAFLFAVLIIAGRPMAVLHIFAGAATVWILVVAAISVPLGRQRNA